MLGWMTKFFERRRQKKEQRRQEKLVNEYREFAATFGDGLSYSYLGSPNVQAPNGKWLDEAACWDELDRLEVEYAGLGYRIIPLDDWISYGGYGKSIDHLWLKKREVDERPVYTRNLTRKE